MPELKKRWLRPIHPRRCSICGRALDVHGEQRDVRYKLPDCVRDVPESERSSKIRWGSENILSFDPHGTFETGHTFLRCLLEVHVIGRSPARVVFGTWLEVHPDVARRASEIWNTPEYADLTVEGLLANAIPPWRGELINKGCVAAVREATELPVIVSSPSPLMSQVLTDKWPPQEILPSLP